MVVSKSQGDQAASYPGGDLCQYLLTKPAAIRRLVDAVGIRPDDAVLEAGGGRGHITAELVARGPRSVETVELDPALAQELRQRFANCPTVTVTCGDGFAAIGRTQVSVLVSNLPIMTCNRTLGLVAGLVTIERCVLVADRAVTELPIPAGWQAWDVESLTGDDFTPGQPMVSHVVALRRGRPSD